jgi:hypothetical protein
VGFKTNPSKHLIGVAVLRFRCVCCCVHVIVTFFFIFIFVTYYMFYAKVRTVSIQLEFMFLPRYVRGNFLEILGCIFKSTVRSI